MSNKQIKCLNLAYLFKASISSINGSWTEGNVSTIKKITLPDGSQLPYVSGQSLKYQIRRYWKEAGLPLSELDVAKKEKGVNYTEGDPMQYIDDDLLGYMIAEKGNNRRRTAAVRISPAIANFPFKGDLDLGTKSKELQGESMGEGGNIFETEISYNYYRVNALLELDRIGRFTKQELAGSEGAETAVAEKRTRVNQLLDSIQHIWGGGKQSRLLTDMSPKFIVFTFQRVKNPILLESLQVHDDERLNIEVLLQVLQDHQHILHQEQAIIGMRNGIFANEADIIGQAQRAGFDVRTIGQAFAEAKGMIDQLDF